MPWLPLPLCLSFGGAAGSSSGEPSDAGLDPSLSSTWVGTTTRVTEHEEGESDSCTPPHRIAQGPSYDAAWSSGAVDAASAGGRVR